MMPDHRVKGSRPGWWVKSSPLPHAVPSQPVHLCRRVSTVSDRPGYRFGCTPADHRRSRSPLSNVSAVPNHGFHGLATHLPGPSRVACSCPVCS
jgi:hypothetical protein